METKVSIKTRCKKGLLQRQSSVVAQGLKRVRTDKVSALVPRGLDRKVNESAPTDEGLDWTPPFSVHHHFRQWHHGLYEFPDFLQILVEMRFPFVVGWRYLAADEVAGVIHSGTVAKLSKSCRERGDEDEDEEWKVSADDVWRIDFEAMENWASSYFLAT